MPTVYYSPNCRNPVGFPLKQNRNNGIAIGPSGMPQKFNGADGGASFSMGRKIIYVETLSKSSLAELYSEQLPVNCQPPENRLKTSCLRGGKPINIQSADQHIQRKKNQAIGRGTIRRQENLNKEISFKQVINNKQPHSTDANRALRRNRSSGYVVPPKISQGGITPCRLTYPYCR